MCINFHQCKLAKRAQLDLIHEIAKHLELGPCLTNDRFLQDSALRSTPQNTSRREYPLLQIYVFSLWASNQVYHVSNGISWSKGGMGEYRNSLAASFVFRFYVYLVQKLQAAAPDFASPLPAGYDSAATRFERAPASGLQYYRKAGEEEIVGQPYRHMSADLQVWGFSALLHMCGGLDHRPALPFHVCRSARIGFPRCHTRV
jgi:hypothetical protein